MSSEEEAAGPLARPQSLADLVEKVRQERKERERMEKAARKLEEKAQKLIRQGGSKAKLGHELLADADLLRRMKPSLIAERVRGGDPAVDSQETLSRLSAESKAKQPAPRSSPARPPGQSSAGKKNPLFVIGAGLSAGITIAKLLDWRGHAHPRS